jgi:hypothetical protein
MGQHVRNTHIGSSGENADFVELNLRQLMEGDFSDYFRLSFTMRMSRDTALRLGKRIERLINDEMSRDVKVYVGVRNERQYLTRSHTRVED